MGDSGTTEEVKVLEPMAIFGFNGSIDFGLHVHPDKEHVLYAIGDKISITSLHDNRQQFLIGHTNNVSCLTVSSSGKYVASGQISLMGFNAYTVLWDWNTKKDIARHDLHKVLIQSVCITAHDRYMISLGGQDDDYIIVYDIESSTPICRATASKATSGFGYKVIRLHSSTSIFIVNGDRHLRMWRIDEKKKKLYPHDILVGRQQRSYTGGRINKKDEILYLGTMTGDLAKIQINCSDPEYVAKSDTAAVLIGCYGKYIAKKTIGKDCEKFVNGIRNLYILGDKRLLIGDGDGNLEIVEERDACFKNYPRPTWPKLKLLSKTRVNGAVTSITVIKSNEFLIGTESNEIYNLKIRNEHMELKLLKTCHKENVYDIDFPRHFSLVFATASYECIRIWSTKRLKELLRIYVHNFSCASIKFTWDGSAIISAWNDGVLRSFTPMTGRLIYAIPNAHNKGCSAVTVSQTGKVLVSGGVEGQVRVWKIEPLRQSLVGVLKEHSAPIATVDFNKFDTEVVSASNDGSCVIWDINRLTRKHVLYANTQFMCAKYYPTGVQILATGSDRRISFWESYDGSLVRELEGSTEASVNNVSINPSGEYFVSVSNDQLVKLWDYQKGTVICCGIKQASPVLSCEFAPNGKFFITGSKCGEIIIWEVPEEYWPKVVDPLSQHTKQISSKEKEPKVENTRKGSADSKSIKSENIVKLEISRSNKELLCAECPPVDTSKMPDINETCNLDPNAK